MSVVDTLTPDAEHFAELVTRGTGLNLDVVRAWVANESAWGRGNVRGQYDAGGTRAFNYLNLNICDGCPDSKYGSVSTAAAAVIHNLKTPLYAPVLATVGKTQNDQITAISESPWASGHYSHGDALRAIVGMFKGSSVDVSKLPVLDLGSTSSGSDGGWAATLGGALASGFTAPLQAFETNFITGFMSLALNLLSLGAGVVLVIAGVYVMFRPEIGSAGDTVGKIAGVAKVAAMAGA